MRYKRAPGHNLLRIGGCVIFLVGIFTAGMLLLMLMNLEGFIGGRNALYREEFRFVVEIFMVDAMLTGILTAIIGALGFCWSKRFERSKILMILGAVQLAIFLQYVLIYRVLGSFLTRPLRMDVAPLLYLLILLPIPLLYGAYRNYRASRVENSSPASPFR